MDPRRMILEYFGPGDSRGPSGLLKVKGWKPQRGKQSTAFFSVWRPTSMDAVRMLMRGDATGKSLNIKGKSSKQGVISGFVPFVQIHAEVDKAKVRVPPADARVRVFYKSLELREKAHRLLERAMYEMVALASAAQRALASEGRVSALSNIEVRATSIDLDESDRAREQHMVNLRHRMSEPTLIRLDENGFGLEMPQRLMWEAYVMKQDITRTGEWVSGRDSEPDYMDLNNQSVRDASSTPRVVIYQWDGDHPMNPRALLIAYEENGRVLPVASDFDCFTIGSKGLKYPNFPTEQVPHLESLVRNIERVLATPGPRAWSHRWLEVLKGDIKKAPLPPKMISDSGSSSEKTKGGGGERGSTATANGNGSAAGEDKRKTTAAAPSAPRVDRRGSLRASLRRMSYTGAFGRKDARQGEPRYGFGDPLHYSIIEHATDAMTMNGAVRHAAECYNFYWPQDLDDEFLVVWEGYTGTPWRYLNPSQLRHFLIHRAKDGWVFPLNLKWLLCDEGWYEVMEALESTSEGKQAVNAWLPAHVQQQLHALHEAYPDGFKRVKSADKEEEPDAGCEDMEIAQLRLKRYVTVQRAKLKLRSILLFSQVGVRVANRKSAVATAAMQAGDAAAGARKSVLPQAATFPEPLDDDDLAA